MPDFVSENTITSRHDVRIEFDWPAEVSVGLTSSGKAYLAVRVNTEIEDAFERLRIASDAAFKAVENARREHFIDEVHPRLTGRAFPR